MPSAELQEWVSNGGIPAEVEAFARALDLEASLDGSAVNPATLRIMQRILQAEDEESVFAAANAGTTAGKDFVNRPFYLPAGKYDWKKSAAMFRETGGFPFYALMEVIDYQTGAEEVVSCGGYSFCTTLWRLQQIGAIEKHTEANGAGMPLQITAKAVPAGAVLLLQPFKLPANGKKA